MIAAWLVYAVVVALFGELDRRGRQGALGDGLAPAEGEKRKEQQGASQRADYLLYF